jgi:hypothetical protein
VSRAAIPIAVWGTYLSGLALMLGLWGQPDTVAVALLAWAALATFAIAAVVAVQRREPGPGTPAAPALWGWSVPLAAGLAAVVAGLQVGSWLLLIGAGLVLAGLAGIVWSRR